MSDSIWHLPSSFSTDFMLCYYSTYSTYYHTVSINFSKDNPEQSYPRETWDVPRLAHLIFTLLIIPPSFLPLFYLHLSSNPLNPLIWPFSLLYPSIYPCKTFSFPFQPLLLTSVPLLFSWSPGLKAVTPRQSFGQCHWFSSGKSPTAKVCIQVLLKTNSWTTVTCLLSLVHSRYHCLLQT